MSLGESKPVIHVAGVGIRGTRAGVFVRLAALLVDLSCTAALFASAWWLWHSFFSIPVNLYSYLAAATVLSVGLWLAMKRLFSASTGQLLWRLTVTGTKCVYNEKPGPAFTVVASFLTLLMAAASALFARSAIFDHPFVIRAATKPLAPFVPEEVAGTATWGVTPFYYAIGAWPKVYAGKAVLYELPYEKGPPHQFVGHIIARWDMPGTRLVIEGPRSPEQKNRFAPGLFRRTIKDCLMSPFGAGTGIARCMKLREHSIGRHIREMREHTGSNGLSIEWFVVSNPAIPDSEQPQGIRLQAAGRTHSEERFVFISNGGNHQAFILERPVQEAGIRSVASGVFEQAIRSQRVSDDLAKGKAWADRALATVKLAQPGAVSGGPAGQQDFIATTSEALGALMSKISVDPKSFDAFYHLAGTASVLAKGAHAANNSDWSAVAKPLVQSALHYARDIAPEDVRMARLNNLWLEIRNY